MNNMWRRPNIGCLTALQVCQKSGQHYDFGDSLTSTPVHAHV